MESTVIHEIHREAADPDGDESLSMVDIVLVRHGESFSNIQGAYQGQTDTGLTEAGRDQAEAVTQRLLREFARIDMIVASDLPRAMDTAAPLARVTGLTVELDARLREGDVGTWSGRTFGEIRAEFPEVLRQLQAGADVARGGGETFAEIRARVWACVTDIAARAAAVSASARPTVAVFTHGNPVRIAAAAAAGLPSPGHRQFGRPANTSLTRISVEAGGGAAMLLAYND